MKKISLILITVFILTQLSFTVQNTGSEDNVSSQMITVDIKTSLKDLQNIIKSANNGDVIQFKPGNYSFNDTIKINNKKGLTFTAKSMVKIICTDPASSVFSIRNSHNIRFNNIHATHTPVAQGCSGFVFSVSSSSKIYFNKCKMNGCGTIGLISWSCEEINLKRCEIYNNSDTGISFNQSAALVIKNCKIYENKNAGISSYSSNYIEIISSQIYKNKIGIHYGKVRNLKMNKNKFYGNRINLKRF